MDLNYVAGLLFVLIYLPIFLVGALFKKFRLKFMKVHSKTNKQKFIEFLAGFVYFLMYFVCLFFAFSFNYVLFIIGCVIYLISLLIVFFGYYAFIVSKDNELIVRFPYNFSRNPTYFFGLMAVVGLVIMTSSTKLFLLIVIQFVLTHKIILTEEDFCKKKYKKKYIEYVKRVRRYF